MNAPHQTIMARPTRAALIEPIGLLGLLAVPEHPLGTIIFAHGSGSSRFSPRNNRVADTLHQAGFATLLLDLLTEQEAEDRSKVFDIPLLSARLLSAARWASHHPALGSLPIALFGASTGAGAALLAAADSDVPIAAVVSRGGRPDLAGSQALSHVRAPTLLVVGERDLPVIELNRVALSHLHGEKALVIIPGAHHLFEEPGTLEQVVDHATQWFLRHMHEA